MNRRIPAGLTATALAGAWLIYKASFASRKKNFLKGRSVIITGGSRGLGLILAREFVRQGALVGICARDERELERVRTEFQSRGENIWTKSCNVADRLEVRQFIEDAASRFGGIDILINNASIMEVGPFRTLRYEDFDQNMAINYGGALNMVLEALPFVTRRGQGRIVNICSIGSVVAVPHLLPYTSSKFALLGFSLGLREELAREGIRVTTIVPGLMRTGSFVNALFKGKADREFAWFSWGASLPVVSMNADRAARRIIEATVRGEAWVTLGLPAKMARSTAALMPSLTARALTLVNGLMPSSPGDWARDRDAEPGWLHRTEASSAPLTTLGDAAAVRNNESG